MKIFFKNILLFLIPFLAVIFIWCFFIFYVSNNVNYKIDNKVSTLFIGDSHFQKGIADSLLIGSENLAATSESFYFSYYKLKKILEHNEQIKNVYLGFSYHSLSNYYDKFISGEYSQSISPKYFYMLPFSEKCKLVYWNLYAFPQYTREIIKTGNYLLSTDNVFISSGYSNKYHNTKASIKSMNKRFKFQYYTNNCLNDFSNTNIIYLKKIVTLCKENQIKLTIINMPLHSYYKNKISQNYIDKYNNIIDDYSLKVLDLNNINFSDSSFIPDGDHLSAEGACCFTREIKIIIMKAQ